MGKTDTAELRENTARIALLRELALTDAHDDPFFDHITRIASNVLGTPVSMITLVSDYRPFVKGSYGLPDDWRTSRNLPLAMAFSRHVVTMNKPYVIDDTRMMTIMRYSAASSGLKLMSFVGVPIYALHELRMGAFCVMGTEPRVWSDADVVIVRAFAELINAEIDARKTAHEEGRLNAHRRHTHSTVNSLFTGMDTQTPNARIVRALFTVTEALRQRT